MELIVAIAAAPIAPCAPAAKAARRASSPRSVATTSHRIAFYAERIAALIAWMLLVRVGLLVKDGAISAVTRVFDALWRRRLRRSSILDKIIDTNNSASMRSRPTSDQ
jgi:hypothetical protein